MLTCITVMAFSVSVSATTKGTQKTFATPEDAVKGLVDALKADNTKELLAIFGQDLNR
jgi:hypothetical protein